MKRFICKVTREDEYIIEFDENIINEEWMEDFRNYFYNFNNLKEHAEHLAQLRARVGDGFMGGYGNPMIGAKPPWWSVLDYEKGINIIIKSEDQECEVEVKEIK